MTQFRSLSKSSLINFFGVLRICGNIFGLEDIQNMEENQSISNSTNNIIILSPVDKNI